MLSIKIDDENIADKLQRVLETWRAQLTRRYQHCYCNDDSDDEETYEYLSIEYTTDMFFDAKSWKRHLNWVK
jgi:hypothetical protein